MDLPFQSNDFKLVSEVILECEDEFVVVCRPNESKSHLAYLFQSKRIGMNEQDQDFCIIYPVTNTCGELLSCWLVEVGS